MEFVLFIIALVVGGLASWQIFNWMYGKKLKDNKESLRIESNILLERIEKVFKVVLAEGYFTEIYDHNSQKEFWGMFKSSNKALVVAKAKVSVGYDFSKMKFRKENNERKLIIEEFAPAEILSVDTDYKFYDINQGILNKFNNEDYTAILAQAKKLMQEKAQESDLPQIAANQLKLMMNQLAASMNWEVDLNAIPGPTQKMIEPKSKAQNLLEKATGLDA
ncbi:DUF4230 domain-containing protein [Lacihabitans sp. LS3-19]|uniref:DUF4230 domain-containing protein n=1 Tax=Lacihabitans sp. LS3-19 TaxID=2487335 RepID=UPI0020CDF88F|nr:DUF4230 domain-containing protein [Lacihabitans sp. LS3-19]MCP9769656.1 DUF4230 domain-containing protein [Lacihabitans sp. LS3-19]